MYEVLGAFSDTLRVYAAGGYYEDGKGLKELAKEMEGYVGEGFRAVKMKVGGGAFATDVERVRAVREAVGPKIDLLIDANNKWNAYEAIRFGRAVEKYDPFWFEEPVEPDDFKGCAEVRAGARHAGGGGRKRVHALGLPRAARSRLGRHPEPGHGDRRRHHGVPQDRRRWLRRYHMPVAPHGNPHMAVHLLAVHAATR